MSLVEKEWDYLSAEAKKLVLTHMANGVKDWELAFELTVLQLGDSAFELDDHE